MNATDPPDMASTARFSRSDDVVWRLASDRVLVRRVGDLTDDGCADLIGYAAAVWVALDEPASLPELSARLADAGIDTVDVNRADLVDAVDALVERRWIEQIDAQPDPQPVAQPDPQPDPADADHER
ncbi:MAG: hypothetical protein WCA90_07780 [Ilumatobacteraceae bacterium]